MAKIYQSVEEFIGRTPLMEVRNIERKYGLEARLLVKLEYMNRLIRLENASVFPVIRRFI